MMLRAYGDAIAASNPAVASHPRLGEALTRVADVDSDATRYGALVSIRYPEPDEAHAAGAAEQARKICCAALAVSPVPVWALRMATARLAIRLTRANRI